MIFIVTLFFIMKSQQKANESFMHEHKLLLENLIKVSLDKPEPKKLEHNAKEIVAIHMKISASIKVHSTKYMSILEADRLAVYIFHNGQSGINGFPFLKFSCMSEQVTSVNKSCIKQHHDFPVNLMSDFINDLYTHKNISYYDDAIVEGEEDKYMYNDPLFDKLVSTRGNKYICKAIFDSNSTLIGFVLVEFTNELLKPYNFVNKSAKLDEFITAVSPILEFSDFNNVYHGGV